jgi:O-Antigen ligase
VSASTTQTSLAMPATRGSAKSFNVRCCILLIYYFCLSDVFLQFLPYTIAAALRYLPELILYGLVLALLWKKPKIISFPLFWPLLICMASLLVSCLLNRGNPLIAVSDFRSFFRFSAFSYILWRTKMTPERVKQFLNGFLGVAILELAVGAVELVGGSGIRELFSPVSSWSSGALIKSEYNNAAGTWLNGTLWNYNNYGMFMAMSTVLALGLYSLRGSRKYLLIAVACSIAVLLSYSRHSLILLVAGLMVMAWMYRRNLLRRSRGTRATFISVFVALALSVCVALSPSMQKRIGSSFTSSALEGDPYANVRMYMTVTLTPRFLQAYPFFGQGPFSADEMIPADALATGHTDVGPTMKAAPEVPGWITFYIGDVVWVMVLGLYGCFGLAAFMLVFGTIARQAIRLSKASSDTTSIALGRACAVTAVLVLVSGLFSEEMIARDTIPVFWCLAGIVFSLADGLGINHKRGAWGKAWISRWVVGAKA